MELGVESTYYHVDATILINPDTCLKERGVPARILAQRAQCAAFTQQLKEIRLDNDFGSSGLWDVKGRNLGYDLLNLPFPLVRRVAAWQRDYDDTIMPLDMDGDDNWWERHEQEALDIARELQKALGTNTVVKVYQKQGWVSLDEIERGSE